jgi:hypothetical protein
LTWPDGLKTCPPGRNAFTYWQTGGYYIKFRAKVKEKVADTTGGGGRKLKVNPSLKTGYADATCECKKKECGKGGEI